MIEDNKRKKLVFELGNKLTPANILYASLDELEEIKDKTSNLSERYCFKLGEDDDEISAKVDEIVKFLELHIKNVGKIQAVKDLQLGLTLLNKNRKKSLCACKNELLEDGSYGIKTHSCLYDVCRNYPLRIIKKYILMGVLNNIIFDTKNDVEKDTSKILDDVYFALNWRG